MKTTAACSFFLLLSICLSSFSPLPEKTSPDVNALADRYLKRYFEFNPEQGTFYGMAEANHTDLTDNSWQGLRQWHRFEDSLMNQLNAIDPQQLEKQQRITYGLLYEEAEASIGSRICQKQWWGIDQMDGWQIWLEYISKAQPVGTEAHRKNTLRRWHKIPLYIQREKENLQEGVSRGYSAPQQNVQLVIRQLDKILSQPAESSFFYYPATHDTTSIFGKELAKIIREEIFPATTVYRTYLRDEYLHKARKNLSVAENPNGAACYQAKLRSYTTLKTSPQEVYEHGLQAIAQREAKMREIGAQVYQVNNLSVIQEKLRNDPAEKFSSREEILSFSQAAMERAKAKMPTYFRRLPKAEVLIQPLPAYQEQSKFSGYTPASDDGSRPATYHIKLYQPETQARGTVEATAFHETYPGHHLQLSISRELVVAHPISKYISNGGFTEGWARYCETLADEMQLYSSPKHRLHAYSRSPIGMVVDPGIHLKKWSREKAIQYVLAKLSHYSREEAEAYVDRVAIWPGQMTTYGVGEIHFMNLRKLAQSRKGATFDIREFHDVCLDNGTIPLNMLSEQVNQWLNQTGK